MFYEVFVKLCEQKGKAITTAAKEIGLAPNAPQKWKEGAVPRIGTMRSIADYFGVPIGVLMEREPEPPPISASVSPVSVVTAEELAVVAQYRQLTAENREKAREYMEFLQMKQPKEKVQVS